MSFSAETLVKAHHHCANHRRELEASAICGCFFCHATFEVTDIREWVDAANTAVCPACGVDSVLGVASGYPVAEPAFLAAMHRRWFQ